ncbi:MAG TPA: hypothetical protein VNI52_07355 [Sphingobacteriaceae bacterium]|nr:hypothetical protein [Sphingobacteriaceae bacterium]
MITSNNGEWASHPNTFVILAEAADDGRALAGVRVQVGDTNFPLPLIDAVGKVDDKVHNLIDTHKNNKIAEICGLWNSRELAGYGYSFFILRASLSLASRIGVDFLYALAAPVTVNMCLNMGFVIERKLGNNGFFNYPKLDLVATMMLIDDLKVLSTAQEADRSHIFRLVENPDQLGKDTGPKGDILINYKLLLNNVACK